MGTVLIPNSPDKADVQRKFPSSSYLPLGVSHEVLLGTRVLYLQRG